MCDKHGQRERIDHKERVSGRERERVSYIGRERVRERDFVCKYNRDKVGERETESWEGYFILQRERWGSVCDREKQRENLVTEIERDMLVLKSLEWENSFNSSWKGE